MDATANSISEPEDIQLTPIETAPVKPRVWTVFVATFAALALAIVLQIILATVLVAIEASQGKDIETIARELPEKMMSPELFMLTAAAGQIAFLMAAIIPAWLSPVPMRKRLGLLSPRPSWSIVPLVTVGSWAALAVGIGCAYALTLVIPPDPMIEKLLEGITAKLAVPFVLFIAFVPGIVEELLFRGYVQRRLLERWTPGVAITVTSLLFAIVHVQPHHVALAFPIGLWLGVVAWKTGSVYPSMFGHAFMNGSLNAWRMVVKFAEVPEDAQTIGYILAIIGGLACFLLAMNVFLKGEREGGNGAND